MPENFTDNIAVDPVAELSLDNVLTDIRFRGKLGYKLADYTLADDKNSVELVFEKCSPVAGKTKKP
jgi:hypothetical protein